QRSGVRTPDRFDIDPFFLRSRRRARELWLRQIGQFDFVKSAAVSLKYASTHSVGILVRLADIRESFGIGRPNELRVGRIRRFSVQLDNHFPGRPLNYRIALRKRLLVPARNMQSKLSIRPL